MTTNTTRLEVNPTSRPISRAQALADPWHAYFYAIDVLDGRFHEAEAFILTAPDIAGYYAKDVIKGRWPEAEKVILHSKSKYAAYCYARYVIEGRWPEAEPLISTDAEISLHYAFMVIKDRWPEAEATIFASLCRKDYMAKFPEAKDDWILAGLVDWLET